MSGDATTDADAFSHRKTIKMWIDLRFGTEGMVKSWSVRFITREQKIIDFMSGIC